LAKFKFWVEETITKHFDFEDEILVNFIMELLAGHEAQYPDPKMLEINLKGFLENFAREFVTKLWELLLEAQSSEKGIVS